MRIGTLGEVSLLGGDSSNRRCSGGGGGGGRGKEVGGKVRGKPENLVRKWILE